MQHAPILDANALLRYLAQTIQNAPRQENNEFSVDYVMKQPFPMLAFRDTGEPQPFKLDALDDLAQQHLIYVTWRNRNGQIGMFYPTAEGIRRGNGNPSPTIAVP